MKHDEERVRCCLGKRFCLWCAGAGRPTSLQPAMLMDRHLSSAAFPSSFRTSFAVHKSVPSARVESEDNAPRCGGGVQARKTSHSSSHVLRHLVSNLAVDSWHAFSKPGTTPGFCRTCLRHLEELDEWACRNASERPPRFSVRNVGRQVAIRADISTTTPPRLRENKLSRRLRSPLGCPRNGSSGDTDPPGYPSKRSLRV